MDTTTEGKGMGDDSGVALEAEQSVEQKSCFEGMFQRDVMYGDSRKGAKQFQEDSFAFFSSPSGRVHAAGVFDGHG